MQRRLFFLLAFGSTLVPASLCSAQVSNFNEVTADTGAYASLHDSVSFSSQAGWDAAGRLTALAADPPHHPWDPPSNMSYAHSTYEEQIYGLGVYKTISYALSDYRGAGGTDSYSASTRFTLGYNLQVITGWQGTGALNAKLYVPVHGFMTARGKDSVPGASEAEVEVAVNVAGNNMTALRGGDIKVSNAIPDDPGLNYVAHGDLVNAVSSHDYVLHTGVDDRTVAGYEVAQFLIFDLGFLPRGSTIDYAVDFDFRTSVVTDGPDSVFAVSDFAATSGYEIQLFDDAGAPYHDFTVQPSPVPEPATLAVIGLCAVAVRRRRRRS